MNEPSILDYLTCKGIELRKEGNKYFCSSPFSRDTNWSFCIYPHTNSFFDWSNGFGGSIWRLMSKLENKTEKELKRQHSEYEKYKPYVKDYKIKEVPKTDFDYTRYINTNPKECEEIKEYADSRCLEEGSYFCGVFFTRNENGQRTREVNGERVGAKESGQSDKRQYEWIRNPAVAFLHYDQNLKPCGIKFRALHTNAINRFTARGSLGLYVLDMRQDSKLNSNDPVLYVVEGEANASSLATALKRSSISSVIVSTGAVSTPLTQIGIPKIFVNLKRKLIIDYDGNEELYQERLKLYEHLNAEPIKLILPKGQDINSLHVQNKLYLIENLL